MTIPDANMINIASIPTSSTAVAPPVNNACVPDIYNKLDAEAIEKTRVLNSQLDMKLGVQQKVLAKYRLAAERHYERERQQLTSELRNIARRLPNYADIPRLESKVRKMKKRRRSNNGPLHNCVFTTEPKELNGISAEKDDKPFCDRYFAHHLPIKKGVYRQMMPMVRKGQSMPDLRPQPDDHLHVLRPAPATVRKEDLLKSNALPPIHSLDDNFVTSKSFYRLDDDEDDTKTV